MSAQDRPFNENLDLLIKLLRRMKDRTQFQNIAGLPPMFFSNFEYFVSNYEQMKDQISEQLLQQFGEPIKQIVADMVDQLQAELGEVSVESIEEEAEAPVITGKKRTVEEIDEMLKKPGISGDEIDRLLDERKRVSSEG
jgi:L-lactate utilization protein LutC